ncbi:MAG TPA: hypothetical protein VFX49_22185 [Chloroflexota bacterium]|nr:hypothetical protein [Chloroflexota bacterium]
MDDAPPGCAPNIGPRERRRRLAGAIVLGVLGAIGAGVLLALHAPRAARVLVFLPLAGGAISFFQWRDHT